MLDKANKKIEACEAALAAEYAAHQEARRAREAEEQATGELSEAMEAAYIYLKHRQPDTFKTLQATLYDGWTPEEIKEFEDRIDLIDLLEATRLEEFIGENKD